MIAIVPSYGYVKGKATYLYPDADVTHVKPALVINEGLRQFRFVEIARCHDGSTAADLRKVKVR